MNRNQFSEKSRLKQDLGLDSIGIIDFFYEIEQMSGVRIFSEAILNFNPGQSMGKPDITVGDLMKCLETAP